MILLGRKVPDFDEVFIRMLIDQAVPESKTLDYKLKLEITDSKQQLELVKDITSFHNTEGGIMIFGLQEKRNGNLKLAVPELPPKNMLDIVDIESTKTRISNILLTGANPKVPGLSYSPIIILDGRRVFAIGIPVNTSIPVMVTNSFTFHKRNNSDKYNPDTHELFRAFVRHHTLIQEMEDYLKYRMAQFPISHAEDLQGMATAIIHILPINFREYVSISQITKDDFLEKTRTLFPDFGFDQKINYGYLLEGLALLQSENNPNSFRQDGKKYPRTGYTLLCRDGNIERANSVVFFEEQGNSRSILYVNILAELLKKTIDSAYVYYDYIEMNPQFYVSVTLHCMTSVTDFVNSNAVLGQLERSSLTLPVLFFTRESQRNNLDLFFDILWQSVGQRECPLEFKEKYF